MHILRPYSNPLAFDIREEAHTYPSPPPSNRDFDSSIHDLDLSIHFYSSLGNHPSSGSLNDNHLFCWLKNYHFYIQGLKFRFIQMRTPITHNSEYSSTSSHDIILKNVKVCLDLGHILVFFIIFRHLLLGQFE